MQRRTFIVGLGSAAAWPVVGRAQQAERMRRVGMLISFAENDQSARTIIGSFREELAKFSWVEGRNLRTDVRFGEQDADHIRASAAELVSLVPDVILTLGLASTRAVQRQTQTIPIVFAGVGDPVENGVVKSIAHPEGNTTGFTNLVSSIAGKWLGLLKETVPRVQRVALLYNAQIAPEAAGQYFNWIEKAGYALAVQTTKLPYNSIQDIIDAVDAFAAEPNGGLIVSPAGRATANLELILQLTERYRLPTIGQGGASEGVLLSYGPYPIDLPRRSAYFVDRILRDIKVNELPIEFPTRFKMTVNLKTAKALDLTVPQSILLSADEVIQ
jgi:putative ABC transport system substrate-binding protein